MKTLVEKVQKAGILKTSLIGGAVVQFVAMVAVPVAVIAYDVTLLANPYLLGVVLVAMAIFGLAGYFGYLRPYRLYDRFPQVQAETDGEFLYIHGNKEAKIPLAELTEASVDVDLPFILKKEFLRHILVHLFSEEYGDLILELPGHGKYKMRFVSHVDSTATELIGYLQQVMDSTQ